MMSVQVRSRMRKRVSLLAAGIMLLTAGSATPFGFDFGDSFNEGFDFDDGSDIDMGGSRMDWETPDNSFDTGSTGTGSGFSWGSGSRRSGPSWGFHRTPPPAYWDYPPPQYGPGYYPPRRYMPPPPYGWPAPPALQRRPPAPAAPVREESPSAGSEP